MEKNRGPHPAGGSVLLCPDVASFHEAFAPKRRLFIEETSDCVIAFAETIFSPENICLRPIEALSYFGSPLWGKYAVGLLTEAVDYCENVYKPFSPRIVIIRLISSRRKSAISVFLTEYLPDGEICIYPKNIHTCLRAYPYERIRQ